MQKLTILILAVCFLSLFLGLMPVHGESEIYDSVLRLHVLANSDSDVDQSLKLKVRDAVLNETGDIFSDCNTRDEAIEKLQNELPKIQKIAQKTIADEGYGYSVSVDFGEEEYPTRNYESFCFPSGTYLSLRIIIGEGEGQNWWCVLYPPMCLSASSKSTPEEAFVSAGLNKDQYSIITETKKPTYKVRFRVLEVIESAFSK